MSNLINPETNSLENASDLDLNQTDTVLNAYDLVANIQSKTQKELDQMRRDVHCDIELSLFDRVLSFLSFGIRKKYLLQQYEQEKNDRLMTELASDLRSELETLDLDSNMNLNVSHEPKVVKKKKTVRKKVNKT